MLIAGGGQSFLSQIRNSVGEHRNLEKGVYTARRHTVFPKVDLERRLSIEVAASVDRNYTQNFSLLRYQAIGYILRSTWARQGKCSIALIVHSAQLSPVVLYLKSLAVLQHRHWAGATLNPECRCRLIQLLLQEIWATDNKSGVQNWCTGSAHVYWVRHYALTLTYVSVTNCRWLEEEPPIFRIDRIMEYLCLIVRYIRPPVPTAAF